MLDFKDTIKKNLPFGILQPRRAPVYVGFKCSQGCGFCYYKDKCHDEMFSLDFIKKQIDLLYRYGIRDFELTGGEPGQHEELRQALEYIKSKDPSSKTAVITNGSIGYREDIWDLIDEVLLSYHLGRSSASYDKSMFPNGYTFMKAMATSVKAHEHCKLLRTNTVIGTFNMESADAIVEDLKQLKPSIVNFLPVNMFDQAQSMEKHIDYGIMPEVLKRCVLQIEKSMPEALVFIRYMPWCKMEGYEKHLVGHLQHVYDWFDWNRELDGVNFLQHVGADEDGYLKSLGRYGQTSIDFALSIRQSLYQKSPKCMSCKYFLLCDGVEKTKTGSLDKYIQPVQGQIVKNALSFIEDQTFKLYSKIYGEPKHE